VYRLRGTLPGPPRFPIIGVGGWPAPPVVVVADEAALVPLILVFFVTFPFLVIEDPVVLVFLILLVVIEDRVIRVVVGHRLVLPTGVLFVLSAEGVAPLALEFVRISGISNRVKTIIWCGSGALLLEGIDII
jgi:hypothetical protein